jgi:PAS domain-containing protein
MNFRLLNEENAVISRCISKWGPMKASASRNEYITCNHQIEVESAFRLRNEKGKRLMPISRLTEKKRMEQEIREATKRFEKIAEMGEDGILVFDEDSRIEFANQRACELIGAPKDRSWGKSFSP